MPGLEAIINVQMLFTTVLQMLNRGRTRNRAVSLPVGSQGFRGAFFGPFFGEAKKDKAVS